MSLSLKYVRKSHRKSQNGCLRCKERHVKCDEKLPCHNCKKKNEACIREPRGETISRGMDPGWARELYVMHHFSLETSESLILHDIEVGRVWKCTIPEIGISHPFLMQGLLALSSLHLAYLRPKEVAVWTQLGFRYQNKAINHLQAMITGIIKQEISDLKAAFAVAVVLSMASMADTIFSEPKVPVPIYEIIGPIMHIRGVQKIICADALGHIMSSNSLSLIFRMKSHEFSETSFAGSPIQENFEILRTKFKEQKEVEDTSCLNQALGVLEGIYEEVGYRIQQKTENRYPGFVWKWPAMVSQRYINLLQASQPEALVVFAYFVALSIFFDEWYLSGWSERAIRSISHVLESNWQEFLQLPRSLIDSRFEIMRIM